MSDSVRPHGQAAHQAPPSLGFSRQERWSGMPFPSPIKWALGNIIMNKVSGGDGIPGELFKILKEDAMKVLHSIGQHIWKTQQ